MARRLLALIAVVVVIVAGTGAVARADTPPPAPSPTRDPTVPIDVDFTAHDGTVLKLEYLEPTTPGPHPLVVAPSAWAGGVTQYEALGQILVKRGYVLVGYAERGFDGSGGQVDVGGPDTVQDVSDVITWALANTSADPNRIGAAGVSYGAQVVLLAAARDPRIKAVVSLSGIYDLAASLHQNNTASQAVAAGLLLSGASSGTFSPETLSVFQNIIDDTNVPQLERWAAPRSPINYVSQLNKNSPAILLASGESETVFPTSTMVDFYNKLTVPQKRMWLHPGDHASAEETAQLGWDNALLNEVYRWFDNYLAGTDTSMQNEPSIRITPRKVGGPSATEYYPNWAAVSHSTDSLQLGGAPAGGDGTGTLGGSPAPGWSDKIVAGFDTAAGLGIPLLTYSIDAFDGYPPAVQMPTISRAFAGVWQTSPLTSPVYMRGEPSLHLTVSSSATTGTVVAYLYDVQPNNQGNLIAGVPYSWTNATPNKPFSFDLPFEASGFDIPTGDSIAVAIDTKDVLYKDLDQPLSTVTFLSPAGNPSRLDLPLR